MLALFGRRIALALTVFVSALAIVDDLGAILVIALFYTADISLLALATAGVMFLALLGLNRARVYIVWPYALLGIGLWVAVLASGVHATLAGVIFALIIPTRSTPDPGPLLAQSTMALRVAELRDRKGEHDHYAAAQTLEVVAGRLRSPSERLQQSLEPWTAYLVLPLFALANAGVTVDPESVQPFSGVSLGILLGLVVGKPVGISVFAWLTVRLGLADKGDDIPWRQLVGASCLCGIGFTMSMLIATAGFTDDARLSTAKLAIIVASVVAGLLGWLVLRGSSAVYGRTRTTEATAAAA